MHFSVLNSIARAHSEVSIFERSRAQHLAVVDILDLGEKDAEAVTISREEYSQRMNNSL